MTFCERKTTERERLASISLLELNLGDRTCVVTEKATYSGSREVRTFVDLDHGASVMLMKAKSDERGSYYTLMSALLLTAFEFEAYLNHLGAKSLPYWQEIESIRVMDKYSVLSKKFGLCPDFGRRPDQTLSRLFKFRNAIAHGKSQVVTETKEVDATVEPYELTPKAHWEEFCTLENAERAREDIRRIIQDLHAKSGDGNYPFIHGTGFGSLTQGRSTK